MRRLVPTYKLTNSTESVAQLCAFAYLCTNRTHSASRQLSKWVFFFLGLMKLKELIEHQKKQITMGSWK
jgi:hypothetical protein